MYYRFFIRASVRLAEAIIFVSRSAQEDYISRFGPPRGSSFVIHHGKSAAFRPDLDPDTIRHVRDKYGLPSEFILYIGTIEPRKNLARLVAAFAPVSRDNPCLSLVLAGEKGCGYGRSWRASASWALVPGSSFRAISTTKVTAVSRSPGQSSLSIPPLYEGFGLPVLEALACGVATVTSNVSSIPEVAAALLPRLPGKWPPSRGSQHKTRQRGHINHKNSCNGHSRCDRRRSCNGSQASRLN